MNFRKHLAALVLCANSFLHAQQVTVDPATPMTSGSGNFAAEWNTSGNVEGWSGTQTSITANGSSLTGTTTGTDSQVLRTNFSGGPDLNLGWNDFIDLRIQLPASYNGAVQIFYGTTYNTGFDASRVITIPASVIPKDGAFHTYRIDVGLVPQWRATLRDLRVDPVDGAGSSGMSFSIDYLRVGDEPNAPVYQTRTSYECPADGAATPSGAAFGANSQVLSMESKRFRILWNSGVTTHGSWNANMPALTLRNLEECWQVYTKKLGYTEPAWYIGSGTSGTRYKTILTTWNSGYWCGWESGYARLNITPDGLSMDPPSWVAAHELMHAYQFHNAAGYVPGAWWECHANYGRERMIQHYQYLFPNTSGIDPTCVRCSHQVLAHGRDYYLTWLHFLYMDENPDNLPDLGEGTMVDIWKQTQQYEHPMMTLERLTPQTSLKDIVGNIARRGATFNYSNKAEMNATLQSAGVPQDYAATQRWQFTDLDQRPDDPTWWRVPYEMAPMQGAYAIHELVPTGTGAVRVVTVNFRGLPDSARGADWRASFIVISDTGSERYSSLWGSGSNSVTLAANENKVYLSVAGAPNEFFTGSAGDDGYVLDFNNNLYPYRTTASKARFPYEVQVTGATPRERNNGATTGLTQHSNGGGYRSVFVPSTVFIGPNARVTGGSVSGSARIEDFARVSGGTVNGSAVISGHAWVRGGTVTNNAKVRDWALVESGTVSGSARILEHANIKGGTVTDIAVAKGSSATTTGVISGNGMIDGDYGDFFSGRDIANSIGFGHQPYVGVSDDWLVPLPTGLYASYTFEKPHDSKITDDFGVTDGFTVGSPTWSGGDAKRNGYLSFNGIDQNVILDRSVADIRDFTFTAWIKPAGGSSNQATMWLGATTTKRMTFTPNDGTGVARFSIRNGGADQSLTAPALPVGQWSHVAVTLNGTNGTLYVNGSQAATAAITIRPDQLLAANTAAGLQHNYLARSQGTTMPMFRGSLDQVRFYGTALSASEVAALQPPSTLIAAGTIYVDLRADDPSAGTAIWTNQGTLAAFNREGGPTRVNNVLGSGIPGVLFDGDGDSYTGPVSVADIDGSSDRTIEIWVFNPDLSGEETMIGMGYRGAARRNLGFNFSVDQNWGAASLFGEDMGWRSSIPSPGSWHHLVFTYDGANLVRIYRDGVLIHSRTTSAVLDTFPTEVINIACQRQSSNGTRQSFFSGYINRVRIHGGVLTPEQIAANAQIGPALTNTAPAIAEIPDLSIATGGNTISVPITLSDADTPLESLTLSGSAANIAIVPVSNISFGGSGAYRTATLTIASNGSTAVTVTVSDGALSASRTFTLTTNVTPPSAPSTLTATGAANSVDLSWSPVANATSYSVKRSTTSGSGHTTIASNLTGTTFTDTNVVNGTIYYYVVSPFINNLEGPNSPQASAVPFLPVPSAPADLVARNGIASVSLAWSTVAGADHYSVLRSLASGGPYTPISSGLTATVFTDTTTTTGSTYHYVVTATNASGTGSNSSEASATPHEPATISKADNTNPLRQTESWTGNIVPGGADIARWSGLSGANSVSLGADMAISGLLIGNTGGNISISGNALSLGMGGIDLSTATQNLSITSGLNLGTGHQAWNIASGRMLSLSTGTFSRATGSTVSLTGSGAVAASMPGLSNTNGILGPWAITGSGPSTRYLTLSAGNLTAYNAATVNANWNSAMNSASTNFDVSAASATTFGASSRVASTVRYLGTADTLTLGNNGSSAQLITNGLMHVGTGTLSIVNGSGSLAAAGLAAGDQREFILQAANAALFISSRILDSSSGSSSVTILGPNTTTLSGANSFTGGIDLNSGTLLLGHSSALGTGSLRLNGGRLGSNTALTITNPINVSGTATLGHLTQAANLAFTGALSGEGTLKNHIGSSTAYTINLPSNLSSFAGTLDYTSSSGNSTGWWRVGASSGIVDLTKARVILRKGNVTNLITSASKNFGFSDGINGATMKLGELSGDGVFQASYNNAGPNTLEIGHLNTNSTFSGSIAGGNAGTNLSLVKTGTGTLTLSGTNPHANGTSLQAGALVVTGSLSGTGTVSVEANTTLGGTGSISGPVNVATGGSVNAGFSGSGTLTLESSLTLQNGSILNFTVGATSTRISRSGALAASGTTTINITAGSGIAAGSYPLITGTSPINVANFTLGTTPASSGFAFSLDATNGTLSLVVVAPPAAPVSLSATAGNAAVQLSWPPVASATSYNLKRSITNSGPYTAIASGLASTNYNDTSLTNGITYYYVLSASNAAGEGPFSPQASATPIAPPLAPASLAAAPGNANIQLSWPSVGGATSYNLKRSETSGGPYSVIASGLSTTGYTDTSVTNGTVYFYVVAASNASGEGPVSPEATATPVAPPAAPASLAATAGNATVALIWPTNAAATNYIVKRSTTSGSGYAIVATGLTSGAYTDVSVTNGTTYFYVVTAANIGGESATSPEASATPAIPQTPSQAWRQLYFGSPDNSGDAADNADPDHDAVINLLERAFGGNPNFHETNLLPSIDPDAPLLSIRFRKAKSATDLEFTVQECMSPGNTPWTDAPGTSTLINDDGNVETRRLTVPASLNPRSFLRVRVTNPQ